ncbi:uncharacterized protein LOC124274341 [Haliotis rubra]|uniref:uncharacterized protein LOC124274341 n=1 Tax=Haliotis rubra TaxID=36100 RepID=UPI001EE62F59|nr:uncharacterized protein LOC124274341 [Haliotis rubra]
MILAINFRLQRELRKPTLETVDVFKVRLRGTDLCHGGSVEPDAAVDVSSVEPSNAVDVSSKVSENAVERKSKKRKRSQSIHKRVKRKKTIMPEMECMTNELSVTSSHPSSKAPSKNVTVAAESPEFSVCDNNRSRPVEGAMFPETDKSPKFSETDNHQHIPVETTAKSPKFSTGGKYDHISAETVSPSECATKEHIAGDKSEAEMEGLTEHAVEEMKHVLEKVQVDGLVVADNRLQFKLKLDPSLHTHFKGEPQKKLVERLSRLVKIGYILQQRRQTADGDEQTSTSMES